MSELLMLFRFAILALAIVMIVLIVFVARGKSPYKSLLIISPAMTILLYFFYLAFLDSIYIKAAYIFLTLYLVITLLCSYNVATFSLRFTGYDKKLKVAYYILAGLTALSIILLVVNLFTGVLFHVEPRDLYGHRYWKRVQEPTYAVLNITSLMAAVVIIAPLVVKAVHMPKIYKPRYYMLVIGFNIVIILNIVGFVTKNPIELSILIYAIFAVFATYSISYGNPAQLTTDLLRIANDRIGDGLIYYDMAGNTIFYNNAAEDMMQERSREYVVESAAKTNPKERKKILKRDAKHSMLLVMQEFRRNRVDLDRVENGYTEEWEESFIVNGQQRFCDVQYRVVTEREHRIGSYIQFIDKTEELRSYEQQHFQATHDSLTLLYNRERFFELVEQLMEEQPNNEWVMICSNIRDFKLVNELFGEATGDAILRKEAELLKSYAHKSSLYGRIGDDRFALFMERQYFSPDFLLDCMNAVRRLADDKNYHMQIQLGIYEVGAEKEPASTIYDKSVLALKSIKDEYQQQFGYYDENMMHRAIRNKATVDNFEKSMERHEFQMFLKPMLLQGGTIIGGTALPYLVSEERGLVSVMELEDALAQSGSLHVLDRYIWEEAMKVVASWMKREQRIGVGIRVGAKDLYYLNVLEELTGLAKQYQVDPDLIYVNVAEKVFMLDRKDNMKLMNELQDFGFHVAITEFGSGYSSLNVLKDMHPDIIVFGNDFLREDEERERSRTIVDAIVDMGKQLNIVTIADGVEKESQMLSLKESGVDVMMGPYFYEPMPIAKFEEICFHE